MVWIVVIPYALSLLYIFLFSIGQLHLTWIYVKNKPSVKPPEGSQNYFPLVTVQLPVYNEKYVIERLLDAVAAFSYPKEKLEIQVLDDSTDETTAIIERKIHSIKSRQDITITLIHRTNREGFKAGALNHGLQLAGGELIAIFDADFVPTPDFLVKTVPYFQHERTGVVQTRWGHLNRDYSILTQLQAFGLDAHFSIEQSARKTSGSFINFNGTCGVWRRSCIDDAGGWSADTLTEDLDLSYRAQLKGWKFEYLEDVETPGELPVIMSAIKSQQYRWNKGAAETAKKNFLSVLHSSISWKNKIHAFFHLFNSSIFICLLVASLLSIPMLAIKHYYPEFQWLFDAGVFLFIGFFSISFFYWISTKRFYTRPGKTFFSLFPRFLIISMGLSLHNGLAVMEGLLGRKTPFVRTPKFNIVKNSDPWKNNNYITNRITFLTLAEGASALYFMVGILAAFYWGDGSLLLFHVLLFLGFSAIFYYSLKSSAYA